MDSPRPTFPQYRVLADYTALTGREVNLQEGEVVELVKIGCAGWWYVRRAQHPWTEGWWVFVLINFFNTFILLVMIIETMKFRAPHTYLERISGRHRTLDRLGR